MKKILFAIYILSSPFLLLADSTGELIVRGNATLYKPADQLQISLGVTTANKEASIALADNNEIMQKIIDALKNLHLEEDLYKTGYFQIQPVYDYNNKQNPQEIVGYKVTNSLDILTSHLNLAGQIIDVTTKAGANTVDRVQFALKDEEKYREEIITLAAKNAMKDAKILSQTANLKLGKISHITLDQAQATPLVRTLSFNKAASFSPATPIEAGNVEMNANVTIQYTLVQN